MLGDPPQDLGSARPIDGRAKRQQFIERHAERIDVGPSVDHHSPAQRLLRAHVAQRAQDVTRDGQTIIAVDLRQAEVGHPEPALGVKQEVARLDVAVEDASLVGVVQRQSGLERQAGRGADVVAVVGG